MSNTIPCIDDKRGLIFTIGGEPRPVYQVESKAWAHPSNRWDEHEIPQEIRDKVASLEASGKPGAFVRFAGHEDGGGVYVICEKNIKNLPEAADDEIVLDASQSRGGDRALNAYDVVIRAKGGEVEGGSGEVFATQEGDYYVVRCQSWGQFVVDQPMLPHFVALTKDFLRLLENLHHKNFLSMSPDKPSEVLPPDMPVPIGAFEAINCCVLNLSSFKP